MEKYPQVKESKPVDAPKAATKQQVMSMFAGMSKN